MLTYIKKNLIIAALEDSLLTGKKAAGIATLAEMETLLAALRSRVNADPDAVTDKSIWQMYARLNALKFPSVSNIWWAFNDLSMFDRVETDTIGWSNITGKPAKFPPTAHTHDYASITDKPTTFPPADHAHDLLQIGGLLLRYNSTAGYLEQSTNAGATWTPLVSESAPPSATAYALSWAGVTDSTTKITRSLPGAWINGDLQIWMRVYLDATTVGSYLTNFYTFKLAQSYDGAIMVIYYSRKGDEQQAADTRTGLTGWHDIGLQWTQASNSGIIYIDGVGGTPVYAHKNDVDTGGAYTAEIGAAKIKLSAFAWANALTWSASAATLDSIGALTVNLPLSEGSGATATDSTGTAWTIPAGVVWETI